MKEFKKFEIDIKFEGSIKIIESARDKEEAEKIANSIKLIKDNLNHRNFSINTSIQGIRETDSGKESEQLELPFNEN